MSEYRMSNNEISMEDETSFPSSQMEAKQKRAITPRAQNDHKIVAPPSPERKHSEMVSLETKISKSKDSIKKLRRHLVFHHSISSLEHAAGVTVTVLVYN